MQNNFNTYLNDKLDISTENSVLLAISGGADSVVMLDLFSKTTYKCAIAHCNFKLRGQESDKDALFVKELSEKYNFPFFTIGFNTEKHASAKGISVEMAARELRYKWFEQIRAENGYDYIATAHHQNDVIETFFMNLARGTGIRGLAGIKAKTGKIIRPLLFAWRKQIMAYIDKNQLGYREDASNKDVKIKRNKLRHDIIPQLAEINPAYRKNIIETIERLDITNEILKEKVIDIENTILEKKGNHILINIQKLKKLTYTEFFLFEILHPYGFNQSQVKDIINGLNRISGKSFHTQHYMIIKEREYLHVLPLENNPENTIKVPYSLQKVNVGANVLLTISEYSKTVNLKIPRQLNTAALDKDKLQFPLEIRGWEAGDYFYPIGMNKRKKLSDFFIDNKFSYTDKKEALLLTSAGKIVWIIGYRIDNRFKITEQTKTIWQIQKSE